jgi:aclacinomycin oxidase
MDTACNVGWLDPRDADQNLEWVRGLYRDVFSATGGVPAPNAETAGALINHPDNDLADPALNASGIPWHTIYYRDNYTRLQRAKARWDPLNVFHHALSIRPAAP